MNFKQRYDDDLAIGNIRENIDVSSALNFIYENYYYSIEAYILRNSGSANDAEDIFQETILVTVNAIQNGKYRSDSKLKSYLYGIAKNLWVSELRKRKSELRRKEIYIEEHNSVDKNIHHHIIKKENYKLILNLFESLGNKCKRILLLFYYENLSMNEILEKEDYGSAQVLRNKKYKCLKSLMEQIQSDPVLYRNIKDALNYE